MSVQRSVRGAAAGGLAAAVWAAQQPIDKRLFESDYDDVELLGKLVSRNGGWPAAGTALHLQNGAIFGAVYAQVRPFVPGPPVLAGVLAGLAEHAATWPLARITERHHPARGDLPKLAGNNRAFAQAAWRNLLFGLVLGLVEGRLNAQDEAEEPPLVPVSSNGHGDIETAVGATPSA